MWYYFLIFLVFALFGFLFGSRAYLKRVASVMMQMGLPADQVDKVVYLVTNYKKLQREAKKATKEAYKKSIVSAQLEKMKKEEGNGENG